MANLPESATYDAGVYQLELTDPVQGGSTGVSNAPLKNLANRTAWLKSQIDGINNGTIGLALYARLASPTFTGSPAAPTAALGDNTTKLATTAFVQATLGGFLSKSIAGTGSVTLTAVEAGNGIIMFTGALTGNRDVIVPSSPTRSWIIRNATTGAFSVTVKTAAGVGVVVAQGQNAAVFCDGTNVLAGESWAAPLASPVLTGNPTAPTPAQFDSSTKLATTEFVARRGQQFRDFITLNGNASLTAAHVGALIFINGSYTLTLPTPASLGLPLGATFTVITTSFNTSVAAGAGATLNADTTYASQSVKPGEALTFVVVSGSAYHMLLGAAGLGKTAGFASSQARNGYGYLPNGLIIQWGYHELAGNALNTKSFPIAFPTQCLHVTVGGFNNSAPAGYSVMLSGGGSGFNSTSYTTYNNGTTGSAAASFIAVGN